MLYLVPTPIGNLSDMTYRAVDVLKNASLIACEDTRTSRTLLSHYDIKTPVTSYHEFNKIEKAEALLMRLRSGEDVALITDAGTPGISDPGEELVKFCFDEDIEVCALPGACAAICAAVSSGQSVRRLAFEGFLPKDKKDRARILGELKAETRTIVIYEAPHHLTATLKELSETLGKKRGITLCRELSKLHEEKIRTTIEEALSYYDEGDAGIKPRGEYVLVIEGKTKDEALREMRDKWEDIPIADHLKRYTDEGMDKKSAMKRVAADRGVAKRDIYRALLDEGTEE